MREFHEYHLLHLFSFLPFLLSYSQIAFSSSGHLCHHDQSSALQHLKQEFTIEEYASEYSGSYPKVESWKAGSDCCSWDGVTCNEGTGNVIGLDLGSSWLSGSIHSNSSLFRLHHLRRLNLNDNHFNYSQIPSGFGRLVRLTHLDLSYSMFIGQIPLEISQLTKLVSLNLSCLVITPLKLEKPSLKTLVQNLSGLRELYLAGVNIFSEVPDLLSKFPSLTSLDLRDCKLYGSFPVNIFHLPKLHILRIGMNPALNGTLPEFSSGSSLRLLDLYNTSFAGDLPKTICNLKQLYYLNLAYCSFSGSAWSWLGNLTHLTVLRLWMNHFNGQILPSLANLTQLTHLNLRSNDFNGQIPSSLTNLTRLTFLDLSINNFNGQILSSLAILTQLTILNLSRNNFSGPIPSSLTNLTQLERLQLYENQIKGPIPPSLFALPMLEILDLRRNQLSGRLNEFHHTGTPYLPLQSIWLSNNELQGPIPRSFFKCMKLRYLSLDSNNFSGAVELDMFLRLKILRTLDLSYNGLSLITNSNSIENSTAAGPLSITAPNIEFFSISNNNLSGEIPPMICKLTSLQTLDLSNNLLSGSIPQCLGDFSNSLSSLILGRNNFHGTISLRFTNESILRAFDINGNQLEGQVPRSLINCTSLEVLNLGNNHINDTFPYWLETLPKLQVLVLRSNKFHGPIGHPRADLSFPALRIVDLSYNAFAGYLPSEYFQHWNAMMMANENNSQLNYMGDNYYNDSVKVVNKGLEMELVRILTIFIAIDLSNNKFQGEIPESIGHLKSLRVLNFSHNRLTGSIPTSLGNLTVVESLDLSQNKLSGGIPLQLVSLTFLAVLNLSQNHLVGRIPMGNQFDTFTNNSFEGNLALCGFPLSMKCGDGESGQPPPSALQQCEHSENSTCRLDWKIMLMGYGCGTVIGVVIGQIFFWWKNEWFMWIVEACQFKQRKRSKENALRRGRG